MAANRKLLSEIQQVMKKYEEGVLLFDDIWEKVYAAGQQSLKEKYETDLKKEIKKLQRLRDQIKNWIGSNEVKDKTQLIEARKVIETKMEQFKVCEKDTKTKAYSKEGLLRDSKLDPKELLKEEKRNWINDCLERLNDLIDSVEADKEKVSNSKGSKSKNKELLEKFDNRIQKHKWHINKLEHIIKLIDNDDLDPSLLDSIKDSLEYYLESAADDDGEVGVEDEFDIYEDLQLDSITVSVSIPLAFEVPQPKSISESIADTSITTVTSEVVTIPENQTQRTSTSSGDEEISPSPAKKTAVVSTGISKTGSTFSKVIPNSPAPTTKPVTSSIPPVVTTTTAPNPNPNSKPSSQQTLPSLKPSIPAAVSTITTKSTTITTSSSTASSSTAVTGKSASVPIPFSTEKKQGSSDSEMTQTPPLSWAAHAASTSSNTNSGNAPPPSSSGSGSTNTTSISSSVTNVPSLTPQTMSQTQKPPPTTFSPLIATPVVVPQVAITTETIPSNVVNPSPAANAPPPLQQKLSNNIMSHPQSAELAANLLMLKSSMLLTPESLDFEKPPPSYTPRNFYSYSHTSYPTSPLFNNQTESNLIFERLPMDALFFVFYFQQGTYQQCLAAKQLKKYSWRFHKKYMTWFQRHEEPKIATDEFEEGTYVYFDYESGWCQRIKSEFKFEYAYLEDELSNGSGEI